MVRIGVISDTHGTFDEPLRLFLKDVDEIWHAGDIGSRELASEIAAFKPLRAVYGNIDGGATRMAFGEELCFKCEDGMFTAPLRRQHPPLSPQNRQIWAA